MILVWLEVFLAVSVLLVWGAAIVYLLGDAKFKGAWFLGILLFIGGIATEIAILFTFGDRMLS